MISLFREWPFQIQIQGRLSILRFAAGFSKAVDPLSGMTVNLKYVNSWLEALGEHLESKVFSDPCGVLQAAQTFLEPLAVAQQASLMRVQIQFENLDLLLQSRGKKSDERWVGFFQRSWWVTDTSQAQRVQVIAKFPVLNWAEAEELQNLRLPESLESHVQELFYEFPIQPFSIEVRSPLTLVSVICNKDLE